MHRKRQIPAFVISSLLLTLLTPMTADGQQKHTFRPLPKDAKIISEKDGVRTIQFEDGVLASELSKEKREEEKNQPGYTPEQLRNAEPFEIIAPSRPNSAPQVTQEPPPSSGPGVKVPGRLPKKNLKPPHSSEQGHSIH